MSFGYGVGDFLAVGKLALKVYNVYKDAPAEFKDISDEIDSLQIILGQQDRAFQDGKLSTKQKEELGRILQGCKNVLKDLDELMTKYQSLGAPQSSRAIDRLKWDPEDVVKLRGRLTSNITLLNTFISKCVHQSLNSHYSQSMPQPLVSLQSRPSIVLLLMAQRSYILFVCRVIPTHAPHYFIISKDCFSLALIGLN